MTFTLAQRLLAAGALCLLALVSLVAFEARARAAGTEVILDLEPVDPRALLSGHYVILGFAQTLAPDAACPPIAEVSWSRRHEGWVALRREGDRHVVSGAASTRAKAERLGEIVVRGAATCNPPTPSTKDGPGAPGAVRLELPVDRYYADQDEAEAIEKAMRDRAAEEARVAAILSIGKDGAPRTKGLIVDGERVELTWF
jgi:uncharacterized membrane-anchored protein